MNKCKVCKETPEDCICRSTKNESLLSEDEMGPLREQMFGPGVDVNNQIRVFMELCLIAQHLKTRISNNKEWFNWGESTCPHSLGDFYDKDEISTQCFKSACSQCWEERKKKENYNENKFNS